MYNDYFIPRSKHEEQHKPALHKGVVIKFNANQRYATTSITTAIVRDIAQKAQVPLQVNLTNLLVKSNPPMSDFALVAFSVLLYLYDHTLHDFSLAKL